MFVDAHNHILDYMEAHYCKFGKEEIKRLYPPHFNASFCTSSNERISFLKQETLCSFLPSNIKFYFSFGIHPQAPTLSEINFLELLLKNKKIVAVGECGFDLFNDEYRAHLKEQKEVWNAQIELAIKYEMPIVIHCRRSLYLIFEECKKLAKLKSVIFHGWAGSKQEASSLLRRGINAYFCIGKALLRGQKSQIEMATTFAQERLLTETDCPYMQLKNEAHTLPHDIENVVRSIATKRNTTIQELSSILHVNFCKAYYI